MHSRAINILRRFLTGALLLFVGVSFVWMAVGERLGAWVMPEAASQPSTRSAARFTVYYFHGNKRCETCEKMEKYALEALNASFAEELAKGMLEWRVVNREKEENAHFIQEYQLTTQAIILADHGTGRWTDLYEIWMRVEDKPDYLKYVRENVREFMGESE